MCLGALLLRSNCGNQVATIEGLLYKMYYSLSSSFKLAVLNIPKRLPQPLFINRSCYGLCLVSFFYFVVFPSPVHFFFNFTPTLFFISLFQVCSVLDFWFLHVSSAFVRLLISLVFHLSHFHKKQCAID